MKQILFQAKFKVMRHASSKNEKKIHRSGSRSWIGSSNRSTECEKWIMRYLVLERIKQRIDQPIECDVNAKFIFYYPKTVYYTKKGVRSKTINDLSNNLEIVQDCLQEAKIILNDTQICGLDGCRREQIEGTEYYLSIEITKFEEEKICQAE